MLNQNQRALFADKFMDLANLIFAALVVGQVMAQRIDRLILLIGFTSYIILSGLAYIFEIERKRQ